MQNTNLYNKGVDAVVSCWCRSFEVDGDNVEK
jgi:hypothetical protein